LTVYNIYMEKKVLDYIFKYDLIKKGETVGVATSGGVDSMVLLFLLKKFGFKVKALHFEHGIRGEESLRDAKFVEDFCKKYSIPFVMGRASVPMFAEENKLSIETAARKLRYDFFASCDADKIAVAHHADDQTETILQHIIRGSGIKGLVGMLPRSENIIRPLLCVTKDEIVEYSTVNGIPYVCDSTNDDIQYSRNKIRHNVIPQLKEMNPNLTNSMLRLSAFASDTLELIKEQAKNVPFKVENGEAVCDAEALKKQNKAVAAHILYNMFCAVGQEVDIEAGHYEEILALDRTGAKKHIKNGYFAKYSYGMLIISNKQSKIVKDDYCIGFSDVVDFPGGRIEKTKTEFSLTNQDKTCECFSHIPDDAVVRTRRDGDVFIPLGGRRKKLKDYFINEKIPSEMRSEIPLLASGNNIIWVIGYAVSEDYKVENAAEYVALKYTDRR